MKATRPLDATGFERRSLSFPQLAKVCLRSNRALQRAVEHGQLAQICTFARRGDLGCIDVHGRTLTNIAQTSDYLLPKQRDEVTALLKDLPGRLAVLGGDDDGFVGLKSNEDRWKHKHTVRNKNIVNVLRENCGGDSKDWSLELVRSNPLILKLDRDKLSKSTPTLVRKVGVQSTMLTLKQNPAIGAADPERLLDVLPSLTQLLGHKDVALYFLTREPSLVQLNQQFLRTTVRQLNAIFDDNNTVLSVLKHTVVPRSVAIVSTLQTYGGALGSYNFVSVGVYKKVDEELFLLMADNRWEITKKKEPESLAPLQRCRPEGYLDVSHVDPRLVSDPSQTFATNNHWQTWTGDGWKEDKQLSVTHEKQPATCLLRCSSETLQATYNIVSEMLGRVWVHSSYSKSFVVRADIRDRDALFFDFEGGYKFRQLGEFLPKRKFTFISPKYGKWKKRGGDDFKSAEGVATEASSAASAQSVVLVKLWLWEPTVVYQLFWVSETAAQELFVPDGWKTVGGMNMPNIGRGEI